MQAISRVIVFDPFTGSGPRHTMDSVNFNRPVRTAVAALTGYTVSFPQSTEGRRLGLLQVDLRTSVDAEQVSVDVTYGLRDWSGHWDDAYAGTFRYVIYAELEPDDAQLSDDIRITDVEYNQATQFFRSHLILDQATQQPDNAVPLVARKATGIRIYADFNPATPLDPLIFPELTGELEVVATLGTEVLLPVNETTVAGRDTEDDPINRSNNNGTVNFVIPEHLCQGTVRIRGRVRLAEGDETWSPTAERTLRFVEKGVLNLYAVGVRLTSGPVGNTSPPLGQIEEMLTETRLMFPGPDVIVTGNSTLEMPGSILESSTIMDAMFEALIDLRGDSEDVYYGFFPDDIVQLPQLGEIMLGGAAHPEIPVAFSFLAATNPEKTMAHELGHTRSLRHAPAGTTDALDPDYPEYGSFDFGSIGQHGFNTATGSILAPETFLDVMSYANPQWISPYTYRRLGGFPSLPPGVHVTAGPARKPETLFLSLSVDRNDCVTRFPSFHYPARPRRPLRRSACYSVELRDDCRRLLLCWPLPEPSYGEVEPCWPKVFRVALPFVENVRWLMVWNGRNLIYEECIPQPPAIDLNCAGDEDGLHLNWAVSDAGERTTETWALVQWRDVGDVWRGLAPRTRDDHAFVPAHLAPGRTLNARVLVSSGIATAQAECGAVIPRAGTGGIDITVVEALTVPDQAGRRRGSLRAIAHDAAGRTIPDAEFGWFDDQGRMLRRGSVMPTSRLPDSDAVTVHATGAARRPDQPSVRFAIGPAIRPRRRRPTRPQERPAPPRRP